MSNFTSPALGRPATDGVRHQTRSSCYADDLVHGLLAMLDTHIAGRAD